MPDIIRKFQEQREELEAQLDQLKKKSQEDEARCGEAERQLGDLSWELEQLRGQQGQQASARSPAVDEAARRALHEKQLAFMATIDGLRMELQEEQAKARALERRASQAEMRSRQASTEELEGTRAVRRAVATVAELSPEAVGTSSSRLDPSRAEVRALEDEALQLREELNAEKQKCMELKKAARQRGEAWKEQLERITDEVGAKQRLEEENAQLRLEHARLRRDLGQLQDREGGLQSEAEQLRREVADARAAKNDARTEAAGKVEEMQHLSKVVGNQLVAVEQELTQQVQKSNQLFELFLQHSLVPLSTVRRCCRQLALELAAPVSRELCDRPVPPMCEANVHDLKNNLVKLVNLLRYCADILDAHDALRQSQRKGGGSSSGGAPEESSKSYTPGWLQGVLA